MNLITFVIIKKIQEFLLWNGFILKCCCTRILKYLNQFQFQILTIGKMNNKNNVNNYDFAKHFKTELIIKIINIPLNYCCAKYL